MSDWSGRGKGSRLASLSFNLATEPTQGTLPLVSGVGQMVKWNLHKPQDMELQWWAWEGFSLGLKVYAGPGQLEGGPRYRSQPWEGHPEGKAGLHPDG